MTQREDARGRTSVDSLARAFLPRSSSLSLLPLSSPSLVPRLWSLSPSSLSLLPLSSLHSLPSLAPRPSSFAPRPSLPSSLPSLSLTLSVPGDEEHGRGDRRQRQRRAHRRWDRHRAMTWISTKSAPNSLQMPPKSMKNTTRVHSARQLGPVPIQQSTQSPRSPRDVCADLRASHLRHVINMAAGRVGFLGPGQMTLSHSRRVKA